MFFKKKNNIEVVPESDYTDFSERLEQYASVKTVAIASIIPTAASVGLVAHRLLASEPSSTIPVSAPVVPDATTIEPVINSVVSSTDTIPTLAQPTGIIADKSLDMLANVLDPLVQIMVAVSFPVASVIMIGACFFFMFGNSEKAWSMIMNAGLGYVLIQLSPLFLNILREVGSAV
ncbi:hypothetical protein BK128_18100 [Viridibacillus sp. FSL H7-0596]|uniref:hypothetical protein n=1 Tax=Viridibacillus sp. FSL H7-0596 TaxID=1928923 RepID=UPI00096FDE64|nr:hypothetical protein [Viridibacillus sp. FSL H7-0596]OMC83622.1 hypothetical protein BK128_18100 [Viridibacillus sp. FSL H7-0596]